MTFPFPELTRLNSPYWEGLADGILKYQHCAACGQNWLPARAACPRCLKPDAEWRVSQGRGKVVSWVVYHHAYADFLKAWIPYDVTIVELDEGPRLLTNVVNSDAGRALKSGLPVTLNVETVEGTALARFRIPLEEQNI